MPKYLILSPTMRKFIQMSQDEIDALKGTRRTQYRYRLKSRIALTFEELEEIVRCRPKSVEIDDLMRLMQQRLRHSFPDENVAIRIETKRKRK